MTRHPGSPTVVLRTVLTAPLLSAFLVLAIAVLACGAALVPPLVDQARTATVQHEIDGIPAIARPLVAVQRGVAGLGRGGPAEHDVWSGQLGVLEAERARQPEPLRSALGEPRVIGSLGATGLLGERKTRANTVQLVMDPGLERRSRLVQGAYPTVTDPAAGVGIVLTARSAQELDWKVGEVRFRQELPVTLTGLVEPNGADDADWDLLVGSRTPTIQYTPTGDVVLQTVGFLAPDEAGVLGDLLANATTLAWMPFERSAIRAGDAATLASQLRLFLANPVFLEPSGDFYNQGLRFTTPVADALERGVGRGTALVAVVAVAAVGPLAVAAVMLALAGRQLALRRRRAAVLARARGASLRQLILVLGGEALLLGLLGGALGLAAGAALSSRPPDPPVLLAAAALVLVPAGTAPVAVVAELRRAERRDGDVRRRPWRRILGEAVVVALAVALAAILLGRGPAPRVDPALLALPVLAGATGTVLALRLLPPLLEGLHRSAARRTGLIALLGPARALRDAALRTGPALAAVIGIAVAVFSVSFVATVSDGIVRTARDTTGADLAVSMPDIGDDQIAAARKIPGVAAVATLDADEIGQGASATADDRVRVYAVDRDAFVRVQRGFDGALPLPSSLTSTTGGSVPVVASEPLLAEFGDALSVNGHDVRVVARTAQPAPFGSAEKWVIVDRANIDRIGVSAPLVSRMLLAVEPGHDPASVAQALTARLGAAATVTTVEQIVAQADSDPATSGLRIALIAAAGAVAALLAVAIMQTLLLGSASRARLLALLRAVGYPRRGELPLVAWEVGPALLIALPVGAACGLAMSWAVLGALDLRGFTGGQAAPALSAPPGWLAAAVLAFVLVTAAAVLLATAAAARVRSAEAIRVDDDEG